MAGSESSGFSFLTGGLESSKSGHARFPPAMRRSSVDISSPGSDVEGGEGIDSVQLETSSIGAN